MRRVDSQLFSAARQGSVLARCELGRKYLVGSPGLPRNIEMGLSHLHHLMVKDLPLTDEIVTENMALDELISAGQEERMIRAAGRDVAAAQWKLGVWLALRYANSPDGLRWINAAARNGNASARLILSEWGIRDIGRLLYAPSLQNHLNPGRLLAIAAGEQLKDQDCRGASSCLSVIHEMSPSGSLSAQVAGLVVDTIRACERSGQTTHGMSRSLAQASLELSCARNDRTSEFLLGRALCGIACGNLKSGDLVAAVNVRKGAATLLRAADSGCSDAWIHLYKVHVGERSSVANPQMARFFLEKAAGVGNSEAQRMLGASILKESGPIEDAEAAIGWLSLASKNGDRFARLLLCSLVAPVSGYEAEARTAIDLLGTELPWLSFRLILARSFGLTKLEALTVDPTRGARPWGLVVGHKPFIAQRRLAAPRAIPALSQQAFTELQEAADFFGRAQGQDVRAMRDLRTRSSTMRRAFRRHGLSEEMFFANVSSRGLDSLRHGPKWAHRVATLLASSLTTEPAAMFAK